MDEYRDDSKEREEFVNDVNGLIRHWTKGPGGSMSLNEAGRSMAGQRFDRGEFEADVVADDVLSGGTTYSLFLIADWEDDWF